MIDSTAARSLGEFIERLEATYREIDRGSGAVDDALLTLTLARAALEEQRARDRMDSLPLQAAVIGPTQTGKSTVVNLLLGAQRAEASPLAAFTRELTGFVRSSDAGVLDRVGALFGEAHPDIEELAVTADVNKGPGLAVWDTPDFDSYCSHDYRTLIAKVAAVADLLVLVVSKEKYADLSVWETLDAIRPLGRRLVVCLNKVSSEQDVLVEEVRSRLGESGWDEAEVPVIVLPYCRNDEVFGALSETEGARRLQRLVSDPGNNCGAEERLRGLCAVFAANWEDWLLPLRAELGAAERWRRQVDQQLGEALAIYEEQYLDHTSHNDAFKKAVMQLLQLLEIPALAAPMARARNVLTWPLRKLTGLFDGGVASSAGDAEAQILEDVMDHAVLALHAAVVRESANTGHAGAWWRSLGGVFSREADGLKTALGREIRQYQAAFEPEINEAARSLHERLKKNPVMLNTLRASRVSADAAGVVFAIHTGTVGVADALLTPAMLSLTSMMTEGAVGRYMDGVRKTLLDRQRELIRELFEGMPRQTLLAAGTSGDDVSLFRISEQEIGTAVELRQEICR